MASGLVFAWEQVPPYPIEKCQVQAPYGFPQATTPGVAICRAGYVTLNDTSAKLPVWVSYTLYPEYALGCVPRSNGFAPDQSLPKGSRAELSDYAKSGYDIGHVAPNGDMSFDDRAEKESFLLTNMYPQLPGLNRGIWKLLETSVRGWAVQTNQSYTIYVGAMYGTGNESFKGIIVPHGYYKIVINNSTGQVAGWAFPHTKPYVNLGNDLTKFRMPIGQIQQLAGVRYSFPANAKEIGPGQEWPVDYGALTKAKRAKCGANAQD